jgi:large subunit ribosomal protein L21
MFAVIKTGGKQYRTQEGDVLQIEKLDKDKGQKITFDEVLLIEVNGKAVIGTPLVKDASVKAVVLENVKGKKIVVFKKKRRKRYKKKTGHRQQLTKIKVEEIVYGKLRAKAAQKPKEEDQKAKKTEEGAALKKQSEVKQKIKKAVSEKKKTEGRPAKKAAPQKKKTEKKSKPKSTKKTQSTSGKKSQSRPAAKKKS